jgi:hypothetical protein
MAQETGKTGPLTTLAPGPKMGLLLALLLTVFAIAPLTHPGYFQVHSGFLPVYDLYSLQEAPSLPAWRPQNFSPLNGDGLLPYYMAMTMRSLGLRPVEAVKGVLALAFVVGALGMYGWTLRWAGPEGALLAAVVYTYLPYRLALAYVRGAWGEALATGLAPAALWSLEELATGSGTRRRLHLLAALLFWGGLALSHMGLALWLLLLATAYFLTTRRWLPWLLVGLAVWIGLSALSLRLWPAAEGVNFFDHFLYPFQLTSAYWGYGGSVPGWADGMSFQVGLAALGLTLVAVFLPEKPHLDLSRTPPYPLRWRLLILCGWALAMTALLLPLSAPFWRLSGLYRLLSYPWQLLAWVGLCLAAAAGLVPALDERLRTLPMQGALLSLAILASYPYLEPRFTALEPGRSPLATLGGERIVLLDYSLAVEMSPHDTPQRDERTYLMSIPGPQAMEPGQTAHVTLRWQPLRPLDEDYTVFVHLLDSSGQTQAQADSQPCRGECPTSGWTPGEIIADEHLIAIPADAAPPPYRLALGMYLLESGERLPVAGRDDGRAIIGE